MAKTEVTGTQIKDKSVSLTDDVTGILPAANGGTGSNTLALNNVLLGNGDGAIQNVAPGNTGNVLTSNGTTWVSATPAGGGGGGSGDVTSTASTSVDSEVVVFSGTSGKSVKRASGTGLASLSSGVLTTVSAPAGTVVGTTDSQTLTNKTISGANNTLSNVALSSLASAAYSTTPTASTLAQWDANKNLSANAAFQGFTTTATAAGTTTLTVASTAIQVFTGTSTQTVKLPTTSVPAGAQYRIVNNSTGLVTVQSSGANTIVILAGGTSGVFTSVVATPTTAANWTARYDGSSVASGKKLTVSNSLTLAGTDGNTFTVPSGGGTGLVSGGALGIPSSGNLGNCTNLPLNGIASGYRSTTATANTLAVRDGYVLRAGTFIPSYQLIISNGGTTQITTQNAVYLIVGTSTHTLTLPGDGSAEPGVAFTVVNYSSQASNVRTQNDSSFVTIPAYNGVGTPVSLTFTSLTTSAVSNASWGVSYFKDGVLGTPVSGTLTNCTGLPVAGISATGTASSSTYLRGDGTWAEVSGGGGSVSSVTTATTLASGGTFFVSGSGKITLPTAVSNTSTYTIKNTDSSLINNVAPGAIKTTSSQTMEGSAQLRLSPKSAVTLVSDGSNWRTVSSTGRYFTEEPEYVSSWVTPTGQNYGGAVVSTWYSIYGSEASEAWTKQSVNCILVLVMAGGWSENSGFDSSVSFAFNGNPPGVGDPVTQMTRLQRIYQDNCYYDVYGYISDSLNRDNLISNLRVYGGANYGYSDYPPDNAATCSMMVTLYSNVTAFGTPVLGDSTTTADVESDFSTRFAGYGLGGSQTPGLSATGSTGSASRASYLFSTVTPGWPVCAADLWEAWGTSASFSVTAGKSLAIPLL